MRKAIAAIAIAGQLASCTAIGTGLDNIFGPGFSQAALNDVKNFTIQLCNFAPTLDSIASLWTKVTPLVNAIEASAAAICAAENAMPKSAAAIQSLPRMPVGIVITRNPPAVNGVRIQGVFLGK